MAEFDCYEAINQWKTNNIMHYMTNPKALNQFHDLIMEKVFHLAITRLLPNKPPCDFCWFITGSGGRLEQGMISDQDHGIVFQTYSEENNAFFLQLGKEISDGLDIVGYPYCKGNVMSANPLWCKPLSEWKNQLVSWMEEGSWESIRNLQIFYDARSLIGNDCFLHGLKKMIFEYERKHPPLLERLMDNIMHIKKAIGPLGQIIVNTTGEHRGSIDLKYSAFIPYVNAIRLLSIKEGLLDTSTIARMKQLSTIDNYRLQMKNYITNFKALLEYRHTLSKVNSYEETHYLNIQRLPPSNRKEIKKILKDGKNLHQYVHSLIKKGV
ncbi:DUF294 nucleotidyltransferase-like domain-containing protein [Caldibacillus lycopersici]|uniref:DUF294 nucleotidyltransferase-like domain-containing protein n=1 Tax=Perspicuibacillus lycopersici TaxID=1325689 RepID=A0AAE3IUI8_9BACI|nr:DUF294 nucleotidyltransferase-like domain-containing protein [Perspicuibacillus lycopersici]MCU9614447.1 DUF294 nucleotidyltransferase-like domain-containing protein [Perspicuibacillus lycopersici]